jgi:hypothetical protein
MKLDIQGVRYGLSLGFVYRVVASCYTLGLTTAIERHMLTNVTDVITVTRTQVVKRHQESHR